MNITSFLELTPEDRAKYINMLNDSDKAKVFASLSSKDFSIKSATKPITPVIRQRHQHGKNYFKKGEMKHLILEAIRHGNHTSNEIASFVSTMTRGKKPYLPYYKLKTLIGSSIGNLQHERVIYNTVGFKSRHSAYSLVETAGAEGKHYD